MRRASRTALTAAAVLVLAQSGAADEVVPVRVCSHTRSQLESCQDMIELPEFANGTCHELGPPHGRVCLKHECIIRQDCNSDVANGEADWAVADPMMLYFMDREWGDTEKEVGPIAKEVRGNAPQRSQGTGSGEGADYKSVAIIRAEMCTEHNDRFRMEDAKGLRSCHTRYGDLAGWAFPVFSLASRGISEGPDDISVVTNFFSASCAPSNGGKGVCTACANPNTCDLQDAFAGGEGVLAGVRTGQCDIGFVDEYVALGTGLRRGLGADNAEEFRVVCNDGCHSLEHYHRDGCFLGVVKPDVAFARVGSGKVYAAQKALLAASGTDAFYNIFGVGQREDALFSDFTRQLEIVKEDSANYLGVLKEVLDDFQNQKDQQVAEARQEHMRNTQTEENKVEVEDTKVRESTTPAVPALDQPAQAPPPVVKKGYGGGAIAATFFGGLVLGVLAIIAAVKVYRKRKIDEFYAGDMDIANGGLPGSNGATSPDSPFHVDLPENNLPSTPPHMRS